MQGAGDDWWECFPVGPGMVCFRAEIWGSTLSFQTHLSLHSNLCFWRKLLNPRLYVSASEICSMKECGSNFSQFNLLQAHQASVKTQQKCNLTLNNMHDLTEKPNSVFLWRQTKPAACELIHQSIKPRWHHRLIINIGEPQNVACAVWSCDVITAKQTASTFLRPKFGTTFFLEVIFGVFLIPAQNLNYTVFFQD